MSTTKLQLYNNALRMCGERKIASLTEDRKPRHLLDDAWDDNVEDECLESGQWNFAMRAQRLDYDPSVEPDFGYRRAFAKPSDWVATSAMCSDEYFSEPLTQFVDEAGYWYADIDELYIQFVSNDASYGGDLSLWTNKFARYVAATLAVHIVSDLTGDQNRIQYVHELQMKYLKEAKNHDAMGSPTKFPAEGSWNRSRHTMSGSRRDRGNRSSLIG